MILPSVSLSNLGLEILSVDPYRYALEIESLASHNCFIFSSILCLMNIL